MNAITYIQQHGVDKAREELKKLPNSNVTHMTSDARMFVDENNPLLNEFQCSQIKDLICIKDLKRLVESIDLIKAIGGIEIAKRKVKMADFNGFLLISFQAKDGLASVYIQKAQQAIADYEQIFGGEHV